MRPVTLAFAMAAFLSACAETPPSASSASLPVPSRSLVAAQAAGASTFLASAVADDRCMDVMAAERRNGAVLLTWNCHQGANQSFSWRPDGSLRAYGATSNLCVDVMGDRGYDGDPIILWSCHGGANQRWTPTAAGEIRGLYNKCLAVRNGSTVPGARLVLQSCNGSPSQRWTELGTTAPTPTPVPVPVITVITTPSSDTLTVGETTQLAASARDSTGGVLTGRSVTWSSSATAVATVNASGLVTAIAAGATGITATIEGRSSTVAILVTAPVQQPQLVGLDVTPTSVALASGASQQFGASARWSDGSTRAIAVTWSATGGRISTNGFYTAGGSGGNFQVVARDPASGRADTSLVTVSPPPPPPPTAPGARCQNEPAGFTRAVDSGFDVPFVAWPNHNSEGWSWNVIGNSRLDHHTLAPEATAPMSPSSVVRLRFPQGLPGGDNSIWFTRGDLPANSGQIYMCTWMRVDPNWTNNGNAGTKAFFIRTPYWDGAGKTNHFWGLWTLSHSRQMVPMSGTQFGVPGPETSRFAPATADLAGGQWRQVELLWVAESPAGAYNGIARMWLDGQQVLNETNMRFFTAGQSPRWTGVEAVPTYGGGYNAVPYTMYWWFDHVRVSVR